MELYFYYTFQEEDQFPCKIQVHGSHGLLLTYGINNHQLYKVVNICLCTSLEENLFTCKVCS